MYSISQKNESYVALSDLSSCINRIVQQSGDFAVDIGQAGVGFGVLVNEPRVNEHAAVATDGVVMVRAGEAITAPCYITSAASGWGVVVTSQSNNEVIGRCEKGCNSGMLMAVRLGVHYRPNSVGN